MSLAWFRLPSCAAAAASDCTAGPTEVALIVWVKQTHKRLALLDSHQPDVSIVRLMLNGLRLWTHQPSSQLAGLSGRSSRQRHGRRRCRGFGVINFSWSHQPGEPLPSISYLVQRSCPLAVCILCCWGSSNRISLISSLSLQPDWWKIKSSPLEVLDFSLQQRQKAAQQKARLSWGCRCVNSVLLQLHWPV